MTELGRPIFFQNKNKKISTSLGFITSNCEAKIVDEITGENLGPNKTGELYVRMLVPMLGYYKYSDNSNALDAEGKFIKLFIVLFFISLKFLFRLVTDW